MALRNSPDASTGSATVPLLELGSILIASLPSSMTDAELSGFQDRLVEHVGRSHAAGVVIDVSVVEVLDSFSTRVLRSTAQMVRLRGADVVVVGIQPGVALAMVQMGLTLDDVHTALRLEDGLTMLGVDLRGWRK
jgi:rsbT antagonist protein RsbS